MNGLTYQEKPDPEDSRYATDSDNGNPCNHRPVASVVNKYLDIRDVGNHLCVVERRYFHALPKVARNDGRERLNGVCSVQGFVTLFDDGLVFLSVSADESPS